MKGKSVLAMAVLLLGLRASAHAAETVVLTTLEWPPYTGLNLPRDGVSAGVVSAAFAAEGVTVRYVFLPWNRAIDAARHGAADGFFPAYKRPANPRWVVSQVIGTGPLYFVERKADPVSWTSLDDLRGRLIGVDSGFVNTTEIDTRLADGRLHGDVADTDFQNLEKLASRRIDLAIIDANVFRFLLAKPEAARFAPLLRLQARPLESKDLFVEFRNDARGQRFRTLLNLGLVKINATTPEAIAALQEQLVGR
jgi:ABC-type amino acid transport substrate-binding protein